MQPDKNIVRIVLSDSQAVLKCLVQMISLNRVYTLS